jgi:hypothetical protein
MLAAKRGCVPQLFGEDVDRELVGWVADREQRITKIRKAREALEPEARAAGQAGVRVHTDMYTDLHLHDRLSLIDCGKRTGT